MIECKGTINDGIYNCFGTYNKCLCYHCIYDAKYPELEKTKSHFISFKDAINELYLFLQGKKLPAGMVCKTPKLSPNIAFNVIWFLQEHLHILPDTIEQCNCCKELFDSDSEGEYGGDDFDVDRKKKYHGKHFCDNCIPSDLWKNDCE